MSVQPVMEYFTSRPGYTNRYSVHRYMYDYTELKRLLASVGFVDIEECAYKTGRMKDCEKLDTRENSLFVKHGKFESFRKIPWLFRPFQSKWISLNVTYAIM